MVHVTWGLIIGSGKSEQLGPDICTPFLTLNGSPILSYSLVAFERCTAVDGVVVVVDKDRMDSVLGMKQMYGFQKIRKIIPGSGPRSSSVQAALTALEPEVTIAAVHDASRPCITPDLIAETIKAAKRYGSGVLASVVNDNLKEAAKGLTVSRHVPSAGLWMAHTPQAYRVDWLRAAYRASQKNRLAVEDDSLAVGAAKKDIHLVESRHANIKIRRPEDLTLAAALLRM